MSRKGFIDSALYRPLKSGGEYNKLIPSSSCEKTDLGTGDTYLSMDLIKANIEKNHGQVKKLAPLLKKSTLSETVTAIYQFLYSHIQYRADGSDQNLRSPACSWAVRNEGIDCKSYSIFAGCLLAEMGHKFYIRKIKQPGMAPEEFTHVYIIVPKDQKNGKLNSGYHVIDSTKHHNTEAAYIAKNDIFMSLQHFGLQAPAPQNSPDKEQLREAFDKLLNFLKKERIKPSILLGLKDHLDKIVREGLPTDVKIKREGILVERTLYPFLDQNNNQFCPEALFFSRKSGLNGGYEGLFDQAIGWISDVFNSDSSGWLESIMSFIKLDSCFNAAPAAKPKGVREFRDDYIKPWFNRAINEIRSLNPNPEIKYPIWRDDYRTRPYTFPQRLNLLIKELNVVKAHQLFHKGESVKCTAKGNQAKADYAQKLIDHIGQGIQHMRADYDISSRIVSFEASAYDMPPGLNTNWKGRTIHAQTEEFMFSLKPGRTGGIDIDSYEDGSTGGGSSNTGGSNTGGNPNIGGGSSNTGGSTSTGGSTNTGGSTSTGGSKDPNKQLINSSTVNKNNSPQQAGISPIIVIGLIAGGIYLATKKDETKAKKK